MVTRSTEEQTTEDFRGASLEVRYPLGAKVIVFMDHPHYAGLRLPAVVIGHREPDHVQVDVHPMDTMAVDALTLVILKLRGVCVRDLYRVDCSEIVIEE